MNRIRKVDLLPFLISLIFCSFLAGFLVQPAQASYAMWSNSTMVTDIVNGTATQAEIQTCATSSTCVNMLYGSGSTDTVASQTMDSANAELAAQGKTTVSLKASDCPSGSTPYYTARYWTQKGTLGNVNYRWHLMQRFCRNNGTDKITRWIGMTDWLTDAKWYVEWTPDQVTSHSVLPSSRGIAYRQRHIKMELFVQVVPINFYPHGKFVMYGDGSPTAVSGGAR